MDLLDPTDFPGLALRDLVLASCPPIGFGYSTTQSTMASYQPLRLPPVELSSSN